MKFVLKAWFLTTLFIWPQNNRLLQVSPHVLWTQAAHLGDWRSRSCSTVKKRLSELNYWCWFHWPSKILEHTFCWIRRRRTLSRFFWSWTATRFLNEQNSYDINSNWLKWYSGHPKSQRVLQNFLEINLQCAKAKGWFHGIFSKLCTICRKIPV